MEQEKKTTYLQMIQSTIDRMSTSSAIFKGFAATIVAGVAAVSISNIPLIVLALSFVPVVVFLAMDVYYLQLERRFRALYNMIRLDFHDVDFEIRAPKVSELIDKKHNKDPYNVKVNKCLYSLSISMFYGPIIIILVTIIVLKATKVY